MNIGILALQGDFYKHAQAVKKLGHQAVCLKELRSLNSCDKLIIPGGESTAIIRLIEKWDMRVGLMSFATNHQVMGTCAGLILLGNDNNSLPFPTLGLIDIELERNAYGRQLDSFIDNVKITLDDNTIDFPGVFIRAPKITSLGKDVRPLGYHGSDVVMAANKNILVSSFHPELTSDLQIHDFFINKFQ